jgi:acyl transferase domain-containing protein
MHIDTSKVNMLSPQGRCYSFDDRANGFVPGEGVGVMLLKRLEDAQRDGDPIRAVIRGWGVNQDGKTNGITAPNPQAQGALLRDVYKRFGIAPDSIGLVEAHGTGTPLGDPIEIEGLCGGFGVDGDSRFEVALGSVKSNVGHLLAAAGVAGALKAMLALEHRELPPLVNFERENPHLNLERTPFRIHTSVQPWRAAEGARRRAAVSAFGFSGTNAHVVLEEYDDVALREKAAPSPEACMGVLSARSEAQLNEWAGQLLRFLGGRGAALRSAEDMRDLAWTLQVGRSAFECRAAFVFQDRGSLLRALSAVAAGTLTEGVWCGRRDTAAIALFEDDADGRALLQRWVAGARLEKLAEQWTRGVTIDWRALPRAHHGRRLRLPGYPFARDRHWVKPSPQQSAPLAAKSATQLAPRLHPLIDRNASTLERARFAGRFSGEEAFLSHYLAGAERVLLGLFYPEMARAAGELASTREICGLRHMVWGKPARINGEPRDLVVTLAQDRDGLLYRVCPEGNEDAPCHVGELLLNPADAAWPVLPDLRAIPAGQDCSAAFGARMHGSPSTLVREVIQADGRLWARFCRPTAAESLMLIDPLVLDAAWQLVAYHGQTQGLAGPRFPYALALLLQRGALPDEGWIVLWRPDRNDQTLTLVVLDGAGEPALLLEGLLTEQMEALTVLHINDETLA